MALWSLLRGHVRGGPSVGGKARLHPGRRLVGGALVAALLSCVSVTLVTQLWSLPLHVPFQYTHTRTDDEQDATLDLMLIKNIHEAGWFNTNPKLNAPFEQHWAEWPMGGDLLAYTIKKALVDTTGDVPLTFNLFWLLTFPLTALVAFPVLRSLRCSWAASVVGAVLFSLAPYHFRSGAAHQNLAFYVGVPVIVLLCVRLLGPDSALPSVRELRHRASWWRMRWLLLGAVLIGVTGIYYLAFFLSLVVVCAVVSAVAHRRPGRFVMATLFGAVGLAASLVANLPTLVYRWQHAANLMEVPARQLGDSEFYPLRIVELLSPVTAHRFGPFAALADHLQEPGREGLATANLGLAAAIGFVCAVLVVVVRAVRRADHLGWSLEARLGVIMVAALILATKGGLSRALELTGLDGVRAWNRIAIVVAFASIVVFARLLDRVRAAIHLRHWTRPRVLWISLLLIVLLVGVLDQTSPAQMPNPKANERLWQADGAFVASMERQLPKNAMVFQLPVVDFPDNSSTQGMSDYDLIKEGYLHSKTLRWSAGGIAGRDGEWQWPASLLPMRDLVRGLIAMGFSALTLDRFGFPHSSVQLKQLKTLLGKPISTSGDRLVAWDLRPAASSLLGKMSAKATHALAQKMLDAPRLYLSADADPLTDRGDPRNICVGGSLWLVNPGSQPVRARLAITLNQRLSGARDGYLTINSRDVPISASSHANTIPIEIPAGTTHIKISVNTPGVRCGSAPSSQLPSVSASLAPLPGQI
jgi:hypothetical protein